MQVSSKTITIKAKHKINFEDNLDKLNLKALKLNLPKYSYMFKEPYEKDNIVYLDVTIIGLVNLKINDYEFVASLQHLNEGEVLISGKNNIPEKYKQSKSECDHCKINRFRKKTFLLKKEDEYIQVGSSCINDFFQGQSPDNLDKIYDIINQIDNIYSTIEKIETNDVYLLDRFLQVSSAMIRDHGFESKKSEYPTFQRVIDNYNSDVLITGLDYQQVNNTLDWINNLSPKQLENNFLHNLKVVVDHGFVDNRTAAYAAAIVQAYINNSKVKEAQVESDYYGNVSDKVNLQLKFNRQFDFFSKYGTVHMYLFQNELGNSFVWKTTKEYELEQNKEYLIKGTIKSHNLYKEKYKQTELTRCKIENIIKEKEI